MQSKTAPSTGGARKRKTTAKKTAAAKPPKPKRPTKKREADEQRKAEAAKREASVKRVELNEAQQDTARLILQVREQRHERIERLLEDVRALRDQGNAEDQDAIARLLKHTAQIEIPEGWVGGVTNDASAIELVTREESERRANAARARFMAQQRRG